MNTKKSKAVMLDIKTFERISKVITDYPEFEYKTVDEFVSDAVNDLLNVKALQITHLQTWHKR
jgi:outer membrane protein assembly factor BamD (BamD/ComL family)